MSAGSRLLGVRAAVTLTTLLALLSFLTGILQISVTRLSGPLAPFIPAYIEQTAGFTSTLTGFLMILSAFGLRRGLRVAWYSMLVLIPLTILQGIVQSSVLSYPLIVLAILSLPTLLLNYRRFDETLDLTTTQFAALAAILGAQIYGTAGAFALRDNFTNISTLTDAFYFTIVTASTVGYGDVTATSQSARLFAMSVVVLGTASFALALGSLLAPAIEARLSQTLGIMTDRQLNLLDDHVIVLGYGDLTEPIIEELANRIDFAVITDDTAAATQLRNRDIKVLTADPSDEDSLQRAGIEDARAVVAATVDDAADALGILTARSMNPQIRIVAAATDRENVKKLRRAGADTVISPALIGGRLLVDSALSNEDVEAIADEMASGYSSEPTREPDVSK